jgi:uncharacterized membrane protein
MQKLLIILLLLVSFGTSTHAQEDTTSFEKEYLSGEVINIFTDKNGLTSYETRISNGNIVEINTVGEEVEVGTSLYLEYFPEQDVYNFLTVKRQNPIVAMLAVFVVSIIVLAGFKGVRSLLSLAISIGLLFFVLIPLLLSGVDPLLATVICGLGILSISIFVTHGFNYQSLVSFLGSFASILLALGLIFIVNRYASLSGLISDEIQYLSFEMNNTLDLVKIISASIVVGVLGVLDDITITQVAVVRELSSSTQASRNEIFKRALRVGKDHIASLVNTLVFAYVGATLPMIMFISLLEIPFYILLSQEFIFIEIMRSLIGAIALTLAVPLTTWLSTHVFLKHIKRDNHSLESACSHGHH